MVLPIQHQPKLLGFCSHQGLRIYSVICSPFGSRCITSEFFSLPFPFSSPFLKLVWVCHGLRFTDRCWGQAARQGLVSESPPRHREQLLWERTNCWERFFLRHGTVSREAGSSQESWHSEHMFAGLHSPGLASPRGVRIPTVKTRGLGGLCKRRARCWVERAFSLV